MRTLAVWCLLASSAMAAEDKLPTPPQQGKPWKATSDMEREYREVEIVVGSVWSAKGSTVRTHGFVLPQGERKERFAIAWNGLVYPAAHVGGIVELKDDMAAMLKRSERLGVRPKPSPWRAPIRSKGRS